MFLFNLLYYHNFKCQSHLETVKFDVAPMRIRYRVTAWGLIRHELFHFGLTCLMEHAAYAVYILHAVLGNIQFG